ncbi:MAG: ABC transporter substrate-binding protein [Firmicutes bacterium]|nr:ABC transporter substrate-binding protein [Bacillota bacterium]
MMKKTALILTILLFIFTFALTACDGGGGNGSSQEPGTVIGETDGSVTFVDQAGREVTVPKDIDSIALSYRVAIRPIISLGEGDKIKGCGKTEDFLFVLQPSLKKAVDVGKGVADLEALAKLEPDIYFHKANDPDTLDSVQELGIPSVGISFENTEEMISALNVIGTALG